MNRLFDFKLLFNMNPLTAVEFMDPNRSLNVSEVFVGVLLGFEDVTVHIKRHAVSGTCDLEFQILGRANQVHTFITRHKPPIHILQHPKGFMWEQHLLAPKFYSLFFYHYQYLLTGIVSIVRNDTLKQVEIWFETSNSIIVAEVVG